MNHKRFSYANAHCTSLRAIYDAVSHKVLHDMEEVHFMFQCKSNGLDKMKDTIVLCSTSFNMSMHFEASMLSLFFVIDSVSLYHLLVR